MKPNPESCILKNLALVALLIVIVGALGCAGAGSPAPEAPDRGGDTNVDADVESDEELESLLAEYGDEYGEEGAVSRSDPFYYWNVTWFHFNDKFYFWFLQPVAKGYGWAMPDHAQTGINNFFRNIEYPVRLVACLAQGRMYDSGTETGRFLINTTIGVVGFWDAAEQIWEIEAHAEDFDQAIGRWGIGPGWFITWPLLGPSSVRGTVGAVVDRLANPKTWLLADEPAIGIVTTALDIINETSLDPDRYEQMRDMSVEPYIAIRNAYFQNREKKVKE